VESTVDAPKAGANGSVRKKSAVSGENKGGRVQTPAVKRRKGFASWISGGAIIVLQRDRGWKKDGKRRRPTGPDKSGFPSGILKKLYVIRRRPLDLKRSIQSPRRSPLRQSCTPSISGEKCSVRQSKEVRSAKAFQSPAEAMAWSIC